MFVLFFLMVFDLFINIKFFNDQDLKIVFDIVYDYEGQFLICFYKSQENGRWVWNFGFVNLGGGMFIIIFVDVLWRFVMLFGFEVLYSFINFKYDFFEFYLIMDWIFEKFFGKVEIKFGVDVVIWMKEVEVVVKWWILEWKRLWGYNKKG